MNKVTVIGNLGSAPTLRYTRNEQSVANFSVASNRKVNGEKKTTWFRVTAWGSVAENCEKYLAKGSQVYVEGRLIADESTGAPRIWKSDGKHGASFEISAFMVRFLDKKTDDAEIDAEVEAEVEVEIPV